jgi:hypothetical protein
MEVHGKTMRTVITRDVLEAPCGFCFETIRFDA